MSFYISTPEFQRFIIGTQAGATRQALTKTQIAEFEIPLPPLSEQRGIATMLTEQMAALESARAAAAARVVLGDALLEAYLRAAFGSDVARSWPRVPLGRLLSSPLKTGISKPISETSQKRCLTLSAVRRGVLDLTLSKPVQVDDDEAKGNWIKADVFYVVRGNGNRSLVGRGAIAPSSIADPVLYPDLLIEVNVRPELLSATYLRWVWDWEVTRAQIENRARTAAGIYKINQTDLAAVQIPVPPLADQERTTTSLAELSGALDRMLTDLRGELTAITALPAALLRRAFQGAS